MSTVQAFNTMLKNFLEELASVFPEEAQITTFLASFDALVALDATQPLGLFVDAIAPHAQLAMSKDPALFEHLKPGGIDFKRLWQADISDATRDAIWQHINLLFLLGTTVRAMPPQMLESIESMAHACAEQVQSGQLDFSALSTMLLNGGGAGLGALAGLGQIDNGLDDNGSGPHEGGAAATRRPRARQLKRRPRK